MANQCLEVLRACAPVRPIFDFFEIIKSSSDALDGLPVCSFCARTERHTQQIQSQPTGIYLDSVRSAVLSSAQRVFVKSVGSTVKSGEGGSAGDVGVGEVGGRSNAQSPNNSSTDGNGSL